MGTVEELWWDIHDGRTVQVLTGCSKFRWSTTIEVCHSYNHYDQIILSISKSVATDVYSVLNNCHAIVNIYTYIYI